MPHSNQRKKRLRQSIKQNLINRGMKSSMKTHIKRVLKAIDEGDAAKARAELPMAMKKIDKVAKKNIIHKNQASRKISQLNRRVNRLEKSESST